MNPLDIGGGISHTVKKVNQIVYSQYMTGNLKSNYRAGTIFCEKWEM